MEGRKEGKEINEGRKREIVGRLKEIRDRGQRNGNLNDKERIKKDKG